VTRAAKSSKDSSRFPLDTNFKCSNFEISCFSPFYAKNGNTCSYIIMHFLKRIFLRNSFKKNICTFY
jgi:hypothetical protein